MTVTRLDEVVAITMGQAPPGESYNNKGDGLPLIAGAGDFTPTGIAVKKYTTSSSKVSNAGDIVLGIRASIGDKRVADGEYALGRGVASLRPMATIDHRYLWHWLGNIEDDLAGKGKGATFKQVNRQDIAEMLIDVLPIDDQRRIAEVLDRVDELRAKRRQSIALLDDLAQSIFLDMFGVPNRDESWPVEPLGSVAMSYSGSTLPSGSTFRGQAGGWLHLKVSDLNHPENTKMVITSKEWSDSPGQKSSTAPQGSVVFPKRGAAISTNKKRITARPCILDPNLMAVHPRQGKLTPTYLYYWFQGFDLGGIISGSSVPQLNKKDLNPLSIVVPPLALQEVFDARIAALDVHRRQCSLSLAHLDILFSSLQSRAFAGNLWKDGLKHQEGE